MPGSGGLACAGESRYRASPQPGQRGALVEILCPHLVQYTSAILSACMYGCRTAYILAGLFGAEQTGEGVAEVRLAYGGRVFTHIPMRHLGGIADTARHPRARILAGTSVLRLRLHLVVWTERPLLARF